MPNNPGRVDGDYSIGEKEEIKYVAPPSGFGTVKAHSGNFRTYTIILGILIIAIIVFLILW